ncbi:hypothetical protein D7Y13_02380 [Corallococcus praedator]|uniref:Cellulase n=2 Tax=Myxococcaceae TaxID=31 RepID=A0ABX9QRC0_9BACT|nr:hypothetical protein D7X75_05135 [Corallococcus sp. CA031C]RKI16394.1 hypothetical protein D7Y13_02380 [Corallococcus praedator]
MTNTRHSGSLRQALTVVAAFALMLGIGNEAEAQQTGKTTRYWDCAKGSASWTGKASVTGPVKACASDGVTVLSPNAQSGANGGTAFMCNNNQPWAVNDSLAYGVAAAYVPGGSEATLSCACYELTFTSGSANGKKMVVQVVNTGGPSGDTHFDLLIPGGGVGMFNACTPQWNAPSSGWGGQYGGISSRDQCSMLPSQLRPGCYWRFDWFKNADNPTVSFKPVACPTAITNKTGCIRK